MRVATISAALLIVGCGRPNPTYVDPSANVAPGGEVADDLGAAPSGDDLSGPRLAFTPMCGGVGSLVFALSGQPFAVYLRIVDGANGVVDTNADVTLSIEAADHPTVLTGGGVVSASHGYASFEKVSLDHWGQGRLIATSPGVRPLEIAFTIHGSHERFVTQPSDTVAGQVMTPAVQATVSDETGSLDEGYASLSVSLTGCGASPSKSVATAPTVGGIATFTGLKIGPACDSYEMQLNTDPAGQTLLSDPFAITRGPPSHLAMSVARFVTRRIPFSLTASIEDDAGNVIAVAPTSVALALSGASLSGTTSQLTSNGVATFTGLSVDPVGTYTLTASAAGLPDATVSLYVSSWELRSNPFPGSPGGPYGATVALDDANTLYAWDSQQVVVTHDGALTWTLLRSYPFAGPIVPDPADPKTLWTVGGDSVSRSVDSGTTWQFVGANNMTAWRLVVDHETPTTLVALGTEESIPTVWISHDGASTWTSTGPQLGTGDQYWDVAIDPAGSVIYVSAGQYTAGPPSGFLARSTDGGATWTKLPGAPVLSGLAVDPFSSTTVVGTMAVNALFGKSTDRGATWTWSAMQIGGAIALSPTTAGYWFVGGNSGVLLSTDAGATWATSFGIAETLAPYAAPMFAPSDSSIVYLAGDDGIYRSVTGGQ